MPPTDANNNAPPADGGENNGAPPPGDNIPSTLSEADTVRIGRLYQTLMASLALFFGMVSAPTFGAVEANNFVLQYGLDVTFMLSCMEVPARTTRRSEYKKAVAELLGELTRTAHSIGGAVVVKSTANYPTSHMAVMVFNAAYILMTDDDKSLFS
jgi:hypothetical protein